MPETAARKYSKTDIQTDKPIYRYTDSTRGL